MSENATETPAPSPLDGWTDAKLVVKFVPADGVGPFSTINEAQAAGYDVINPVTGAFVVAVVVDGAPVAIIEEQAAHVRHLVDAAKARAQAQAGG